MALKSTPCTCTAGALAVFVRRVAHIDLSPAARCTNNAKPLPIARRKLSTFRPLKVHGTSHHEIYNTTFYGTADLEDSTTIGQSRQNDESSSSKTGRWSLQSSSVDNLDPGSWGLADLQKKHTVLTEDLLPPNLTYEVRRLDLDNDNSSRLERARVHDDEAAFLELNPETIDELAAKSSAKNVHTKPYVAKPTWEARPSRPRLSTKGFNLHYSSPPVTPTPKTREVKSRDSITSESHIPDSGATERRRYPLTEREPWQIQKAALKEKFKDGWNPRKKLSPDALAGIRAIHAQFPEQYTTSVLADKFEVSAEAIRRILKSRWTPKEEEVVDRERRWFLRGQKIWSRYSELGMKPPARWRELGIRRKGNSAAGRRGRQSMDRNITMRSADHVVREAGETTFSATPASMAERIL